MALTFRRALDANILSAATGMAMQAATAPVLLLAFTIGQYAEWILVTAICSYLALALNGIFYALLNEITIAAEGGRPDEAGRLYALGMAIVATLAGAAAASVVAAFALGCRGLGLSVGLGLLVQAAGFASVLFDANFRAVDRYRFGTNVLTLGRVLDWGTTVAAACLTRDVTVTFGILAGYKLVQTFAMLAYLAEIPATLSAWRLRPARAEVRRLADAARGQIVLSASTAASTMGPQLVVSLVYDPVTVVVFTTARTYLRLLAAGVNVLTAASWPLVNAMHARGDIAAMRRFFVRLLTRAAKLAVAGGLVLVWMAEPLFHALFRGKVAVDATAMWLILGSVLVQCVTAVELSLFVATNMRSRALLANLVITLVSLAFVTTAARLLPFHIVLAGQIGFDLAALAVTTGATRAVFAPSGGSAAAGSRLGFLEAGSGR